MKQRKAFALLLTLFVLALSMTVLAGFARHSMNLAWQAQDRESQLQHKWAMASLQWSLLEEPEQWLYPVSEVPGDESGRKSEPLKWRVRLSDWDFECVLADESTKADLNVVLGLSDESLCREVAESVGRGTLDVRLRPLKLDSNQGNSFVLPLRIWAQVYELVETGPVAGFQIFLQTESLTLWGGPINIARAKPETVRAAIKPVCGSIVAGRVAELMDSNELPSVQTVIAQAATNDRQRQQLSALIGNKSSSFSLSVVGVSGQKATVCLSVKKYFTSSLFRVYSFRW